MAVTNSELTITYGSVTIGGSTARKIDSYKREIVDEHDYVRGAFEFSFITTAATDAAFATELNTIRNEFRKPRLDLTVTQNSSTILSRKHSDNTGLDTFPHIIKDGDAADTGRSRYFRVRIEYELPADNVSTSFRRGATVVVNYSPSRRRTVTITGIYTANSTDGSTTADAQYLAQIAAAETTLLNMVDSTVTWERVGQPQIEFFETRKVAHFTRIYREVNVSQSLSALDDAEIIDPQLIITRNRIAPGDSFEAGLSYFGGGSSAPSFPGNTTPQDPSAPGTPVGKANVKRPVFVTMTYDCNVDISNTNLNQKYLSTIRPFLINNAGGAQGASGVVILDEKVDFDRYENRISVVMQCIAYETKIIEQEITYQDISADGYILVPTTSADVFSYYEYPGPAVRQMVVTERRKEVVDSGMTAQKAIQAAYEGPGRFANALGDKWRRVSREPEVKVLTQGLDGASQRTIAHYTIVAVFQFRNLKAPSRANAGGITGQIL